MCVGVKNGAMTLTRTLSSLAFLCDARARPTTPCLEEMYETTPVPPKYPEVEATRITDPFAPSESGEFFDMECIANRSAIAVNNDAVTRQNLLTVHGTLQVDVDYPISFCWLLQLSTFVFLEFIKALAFHQACIRNNNIDLTEPTLGVPEQSLHIIPVGYVGRVEHCSFRIGQFGYELLTCFSRERQICYNNVAASGVIRTNSLRTDTACSTRDDYSLWIAIWQGERRCHVVLFDEKGAVRCTECRM